MEKRTYRNEVAGLLPLAALRTAAWCGVVLLVAAVAALVLWLAVKLHAAVTPVLLALLGSALLGPVNRRLVTMKVNRSAAAALTCVVLLVVAGGAGYIVVNALVSTGDQIVASVQDATRGLSKRFGTAGTSVEDLVDSAKDLLSKFGGRAATGLLTGLGRVGAMFAAALLALLLTFFFLRDADRALAVLREWAPGGSAPRLERIARRGFEAVEGFMRGTTLIALIDGFFITVGLLILQVPGAVGLGALVFVGAYIPYLGAFISGTVAVLVAFADRGFVIALWALGVVLAVQVLEGHVLQPMIQSRTVRMHPALVLVALAAGASLAGILGMLLAVPLTAAGIGVLSELRGGGGTDTDTDGGGTETGGDADGEREGGGGDATGGGDAIGGGDGTGG